MGDALIDKPASQPLSTSFIAGIFCSAALGRPNFNRFVIAIRTGFLIGVESHHVQADANGGKFVIARRVRISAPKQFRRAQVQQFHQGVLKRQNLLVQLSGCR